MYRKACIVVLGLLAGGCTLLEATGEAVGVIGKVGWATARTVGGAVNGGGRRESAGQPPARRPPRESRQVSAVAKIDGRTVVPLIREGKSYYVRVKLNGRIWGRFLLDTGASAMQISSAMARRLGIRLSDGDRIPVTLAGGAVVAGRVVELKRVQLGGAAVEGVRAIVLEVDDMDLRDGLLGMSFLEHFVFEMDASGEELRLSPR